MSRASARARLDRDAGVAALPLYHQGTLSFVGHGICDSETAEDKPMLLTLILLAGCEQEEGLGDDPETFEESIDAFLAEQSLEPADCGTVDYRQACDADGEAAVACFADALATCSPARLDAVESTIEGDPIYSAFILWQNGANCQVERFSDWSEDEFAGDGDPIQEAACYDAELVEQEETCDAFGMECFSPCDDGSDCG